MLKQEMQGHDPNDRCYGHIDIIDFVTYRWELAQLTDLFVARFRLVTPWVQPCILWTRGSWQTFATQRDKGYYERHYNAFRLLVDIKFLLEPTESQGPSFARVIHYLAATIAWTPNLSDAQRDEVVEHLVDDMQRYKNFCLYVCFNDKGIISRRKEWLDKIGR
ncbi:hypothetical protein CLIM01_12493 [Colletotrichum limetticola]|uniref:Uncharacterized protein n=1 Tax=Colletotrichum limetticola TaxID=1209924 RepID=A0ABQ9PG52_9PEZI|nr:hypothetical protein CLIM01_12493 [Colletotrichum limetticola]